MKTTRREFLATLAAIVPAAAALGSAGAAEAKVEPSPETDAWARGYLAGQQDAEAMKQPGITLETWCTSHLDPLTGAGHWHASDGITASTGGLTVTGHMIVRDVKFKVGDKAYIAPIWT